MTSPRPRSFQRASIALAALLGVAAVGLGGYNLAAADVSSGDRPVFIPINPCRLMDTRADVAVGPRSTPLGPETITITAHGSNGECTAASSIPTDAVALSMNVTALNATERTFLTFWGEGENPGTANLNPDPSNPPIPNAVNTPLSSNGTLNLYNDRGSVEVVIDVNGYYAPHDHDDRYLTEEQATNTFITETQANDTYLTETQADARYLTPTQADSTYLTPAQADSTYLTPAQADSTYATTDELGGTRFLARGIVEDPDATDASGVPATFSAPSGVTATVTDLAAVGQYLVTIDGLTAAIDGVPVVTAVGDSSPGTGSAARACALGATTSTASSFSFEVGCFGDDDAGTNFIVAEESSFTFLIIG